MFFVPIWFAKITLNLLPESSQFVLLSSQGAVGRANEVPILKYVEKRLKKMFRPASGCAQHPKAGQNTQQSSLCKKILKIIIRRYLNRYYSMIFNRC